MAKQEIDKSKVEENSRMQVIAFLECSKTSIGEMTDEIREQTKTRISYGTVNNWLSRKSVIRLDNLELIINHMRAKGYIFEI
ncbi:MAG: hypothetical protein ACI9JN_001262 [Bacteroidia bacterium]|jgi:hypothetical protein